MCILILVSLLDLYVFYVIVFCVWHFYIDNPKQIDKNYSCAINKAIMGKPQLMDQQTVSEVAAIVTDELLSNETLSKNTY